MWMILNVIVRCVMLVCLPKQHEIQSLMSTANNNNNCKQLVVKELWQKVTSPPCHPSRRRMDLSDLNPNTIRASLRPHKPAPKWHLDRFSRYCVHRNRLPMLFNRAYSPQNYPFPLGDMYPHLDVDVVKLRAQANASMPASYNSNIQLLILILISNNNSDFRFHEFRL